VTELCTALPAASYTADDTYGTYVWPGTSADFGVSSALVAGFEHETVDEPFLHSRDARAKFALVPLTRSATVLALTPSTGSLKSTVVAPVSVVAAVDIAFGAVVSTVQSYDWGSRCRPGRWRSP